MSNFNEKIGEKIKIARMQSGYETAKDFAIAIGFSDRTVQRYERGERAVSLEVLKNISKTTNKPIQWFIYDENNLQEQIAHKNYVLSMKEHGFTDEQISTIEDIIFNDKLNPLPEQYLGYNPFTDTFDESVILEKNQNRDFTSVNEIERNQFRTQMIEKIDYLCSFCKKIEQSISHEDLLEKIEKILKQTPLSQAVNHINNNIIPFPSVNRVRSFNFIDQPVGAGKTLADCAVTGKFRMETPVDADYAFFVSGSSMAPDIIDGDLLLVKATRKWKERDLVIVYIPETDEWTVKQIYYGKGGYSVALRGTWETETYKERDIFIQGVVREVIRDKTIISEIMEKMEETGEIKEPKEIHERMDEEIDDRS